MSDLISLLSRKADSCPWTFGSGSAPRSAPRGEGGCNCGRGCPDMPPRRPRAPATEGPPFFARPEGVEEYAAAKTLVDWFGTHLVCPRSACRRAGRCTDEDRRHLPDCFEAFRGPVRYALMVAAAMAGVKVGAPAARERAGPVCFPPHAGRSVLGQLRETGHSIAGVRPRPRCEEWTWERDPEAVAFLDEVRQEATSG